eukprot:TRINITY_DN77548_c0_g1_i1.p1 TRINITY_DN77548_c0_g1~~TRINITY_DN77548_c0_g1_i1.p1  ORF type:complete len:161 (+),score=19.31 TRINITY_DN77548_c0_g1_i1:66-548(+)
MSRYGSPTPFMSPGPMMAPANPAIESLYSGGAMRTQWDNVSTPMVRRPIYPEPASLSAYADEYRTRASSPPPMGNGDGLLQPAPAGSGRGFGGMRSMSPMAQRPPPMGGFGGPPMGGGYGGGGYGGGYNAWAGDTLVGPGNPWYSTAPGPGDGMQPMWYN